MELPEKWLTTGRPEIIPEFFSNIVTDFGLNKPRGGLWAAPYTPDEEYPSPWVEWCYSVGFGIEHCTEGVIFTLKDSAKICVIDSRKDLEALYEECGEADVCKRYGVDSWLRKILDYEAVARKYDGFYLTEQGEWQTRDILYPYNLYGFDCASIVLFNVDCIESQEYIELKIGNNNNVD